MEYPTTRTYFVVEFPRMDSLLEQPRKYVVGVINDHWQFEADAVVAVKAMEHFIPLSHRAAVALYTNAVKSVRDDAFAVGDIITVKARGDRGGEPLDNPDIADYTFDDREITDPHLFWNA